MNTRKRILSLLMVLIMVLSMVPMTAVTAWADEPQDFAGLGTETDPYVIASDTDLVLLDAKVTAGEIYAGKYFKVTDDITLNEGWNGIGYAKIEIVNSWGSMVPSTKEFKPFAGNFDGNGKTLTFPSGAQPLFDCVRNAIITDLKIKGDYIADDGLIAHYAEDKTYPAIVANISKVTVLSGTKIAGSGLLGGYASGTNVVLIDDCHIEAGVTVGCNADGTSNGSDRIGGIAGDFNGTIKNSICAATVYGKDFVGGIVAGQGQSMSATAIENCTFSGKVIASGNYVGGILGCGYTGAGFGFTNNPCCPSIKGCTVTKAASIKGANYVGGIFGAEPAMKQCRSTGIGKITGNTFHGTLDSQGKYVGGVIGFIYSLNANTQISNNRYQSTSTLKKGIGGVAYVDTSHATPTPIEGVTYFSTANGKPAGIVGILDAGQNRTDDPLGADAANLAEVIKEEAQITLKSITVTPPAKTEYIKGEDLDLNGMTVTAQWSDNSTTDVTAEAEVSGYDTEKIGTQTITVAYQGVTDTFSVTVKTDGKITVYFSLLGDTKHAASGGNHTLANGGLTTWIAKTAYTVDGNATVLDVFRLAVDGKYSYFNPSGNYITKINGIGEMDNGPMSGWMFTLNGGYPDYGVSQQHLKDGDVIVFHYTDDYPAENHSFKEEEKKATAEQVSELIGKIDSQITLDSEKAILAALEAYNKLSAEEKAKLDADTLQKLLDAQKKLEELKKAAEKPLAEGKLTEILNSHKATSAYLESLGTPQVGSIGGEWMVVGLQRSGRAVDEGYYDNVVSFITENMDKNGRLHGTKSTENARLILALTAMGKDATDVDGYDLIAGLSSMEYVCKQGINGPIWTLIALDSGNYAVPVEGDVTREALVQTVLDNQTLDGGWSLSGGKADPDMTAMALQSLSTYFRRVKAMGVSAADNYGAVLQFMSYTQDTPVAQPMAVATMESEIVRAVERGIAALSKMQASDGTFSGGDGATSESVSQVIVALSALGIDAHTDARFVKNGVSAMDALMAFAAKDGGFKHTKDGEVNGMATEQAYTALTAYARFQAGKTSLYDMTDVLDKGGDAVVNAPVEEDVAPPAEEEKTTGAAVWWLIPVVAVILVAGGAIIVLRNRKKGEK